MEFFHKVSKFPFMHTRRTWYGISATAIVASIALVAIRGLNWGIDFTGGMVVDLDFSQPVQAERVRSALIAAGMKEAQLQMFGGERRAMVRLPPAPEGAANSEAKLGDQVVIALRSVDPNVRRGSVSDVGSQVGKDLADDGGLALLMTFLLILIYVWFRFEKKMGAGAIIAALHDPFIIVGFFAVTQITFDISALVAVLTVIGYSLNDTVVVFDRVRDNFLSMRSAKPEEVIDASVNQTLSRTVITSGATLMVVVVLLIFGGPVLLPFSSALTVGIIVGTYSSIYVAAAAALDFGLTARDLMPIHKDDPELDALP